MTDLTPRQPQRPLIWTDTIYQLQELLFDHPEPIYIVGGAVRDAYLHRPIHDIDLTVGSKAAQLARQIANALHGDVFVMDVQRDVARVLLADNIVIDIAAFRGNTLLDDLYDRDFTINAMAVQLQGDLDRLIDPLHGENDAVQRVVRRCSPEALQKDPLRTLRAVRQSTQLSARIEAETLADIRHYTPHIADTSPERVRDEFIKLLSLSQPMSALRVADRVGLLAQPAILPEVAYLHEKGVWEAALLSIEKLVAILTAISPARNDNSASRFETGMLVIQLDRWRARLQAHLAQGFPNERPRSALLVLALLLADSSSTSAESAAAAEARADALRLSNAEKQFLTTVLRHLVMPEAVTPLAAHRYWTATGEAGVDALLLAIARYLGQVNFQLDQDDWLMRVERLSALFEAYFDRHAQIVAPPMLIDGTGLQKALALKPGPAIGELLKLIREGQVTGDITTVDEALKAAQAYLAR